MKLVSLRASMVALGALTVAGWGSEANPFHATGMMGNMPANLTGKMAGNKLDCKAGDRSLQPTKAFVLHIPESIFATVDKQVNCGSGKTSCVYVTGAKLNMSLAPNPEDADDDDGQTPSNEPASLSSNSDENWPTPLDIDLDPPTPHAKYWQAGYPMLIKIVLDNPSYQFLRNSKLGGLDTSRLSVLQSDEGKGMFRCLSLPQQTKDKPFRWFVTLRVFESDPAISKFGGLNIGILVPTKDTNGKPTAPNGKMMYLPVYLDPQIHNNG